MLGLIHSIESMGLVDGPGIRVVVFMQGCSLRCKYCHNPDMWQFSGGKEYTPEQLLKKLLAFKTYFEASGGGVTFSGGEPLQQPEFLAETLRLCKQAGIHTCIDTAGVGKGNYDEILKHTDLILYDVKHYTAEGYRAVTGFDINKTLAFLQKAEEYNVPIIARHVVVPKLTDGDKHILGLGSYLNTFKNLKNAELLGFHLLGKEKYEGLGLDYPLGETPPMSKDKLKAYQTILDNTLKGD